jgi:hypothetical protein
MFIYQRVVDMKLQNQVEKTTMIFHETHWNILYNQLKYDMDVSENGGNNPNGHQENREHTVLKNNG